MQRLNRDYFVKTLGRGTRSWNAWRRKNPTVWPDLREASWSGKDLRDVNLDNANLLRANLQDTKLQGALLKTANLKGADLTRAELEGADLQGANLYGATLLYANLTRANLVEANLNRATLEGSRLDYAVLGGTSLGLTSLARTQGWERLFHLEQPSSIDVRTITDTVRNLPGGKLHYFGLMLENMGVPGSVIDHYLSDQRHLDSEKNWATCFVSFSSEDMAFVKKLENALAGQRVPHFLAPRHSVPGQNVAQEIEANIALHDRLLVVCSASAMRSRWVQYEIRFALRKKEATRVDDLLLPVAVDDHVLKATRRTFPVDVLKDQVVVDFTRWESGEHFSDAMDRLLSSLRLTG